MILFAFDTNVVSAQSEKIKVVESTFIPGGETGNEAFGVSKPGTLLVFNSKANTKFSRITFMKFKLPQSKDFVKSAELTIPVKVFKDVKSPYSKSMEVFIYKLC